jgi:hypothetical protein
MTDVRKTLLDSMQRSSLLGKPHAKRTDLTSLAASASHAMQMRDDDSWRQFLDQVLRDLKDVDRATLQQLAEEADQLREGNVKSDARVKFAQKVIALATGDRPFALDVAEAPTDPFVALQRRTQEVTARIRSREADVQRVEAEARQLLQRHQANPTATSITEIEALETKLRGLRAEIEGFKREMAMLETLSAEKNADNDVRDITITVGYLPYPAVSGPIPVYPVIIVEFANVANFKADQLRQLELAIDEDGRYKLYANGDEDGAFAETDEPVETTSHNAFQRLAKHWGYWFLRVCGTLNEWDFQIIGNKVYPLQHPIESTLSVIEGTREDAYALVAVGSRHHDRVAVRAEAEKLCDRFETLVGKLPVKRRGLQHTKGIVHARVVQKNLKDMNANAQWVRLDEDKLVAQLKKIMGGPFISVVWERVRTGVDFVQLMPRTEGNRGPDIWLRAKHGYKACSNHAHKIQAFGQELPLEDFKPENVESLREEDVANVRHFYQVPSDRLRGAKASRIEASTDTPAGEVDRQTHEAIVQNYLRLCQVVRVAASGNDANAQKVWPLLRDAVIFELPTAAYLTLYEEFFRYCVRSAKVDPDVPLNQHSEKQRKRVMDVIGTGADAPFPEKLPFKSCFFAYGAGVNDDPNSELLESEMRAREGGDVPPSVGKLYGHLVTEKGIVVNFRYIENIHDGQAGVVFVFDRDPSSVKGEKWDRPHSMSPWIINALVSYVNEHKKLVEAGKNGFGYQSLIKKTAKGLSMKPPIPPPFYVVYLKDELVREQARQRASSIKRHIDWQHRWQVRGHDCLRFMRGPLPLDPELEQELRARRYKIFTVEQPDSETFMALAKRGVPPKGSDEWIAVLAYWRDSFTKGPSDKPLIESVRRSTKTWGE